VESAEQVALVVDHWPLAIRLILLSLRVASLPLYVHHFLFFFLGYPAVQICKLHDKSFTIKTATRATF